MKESYKLTRLKKFRLFNSSSINLEIIKTQNLIVHKKKNRKSIDFKRHIIQKKYFKNLLLKFLNKMKRYKIINSHQDTHPSTISTNSREKSKITKNNRKLRKIKDLNLQFSHKLHNKFNRSSIDHNKQA